MSDIKPNEKEKQALELVDQGQITEAIESMQVAARDREAAAETEAAAWDWFTVGGLYRFAGDRGHEPIDAYTRAFELFKTAGIEHGLLIAGLRLAQAFAQQELPEQAEDYAGQVLDLAESLGDRDAFLQALTILWWAGRQRGRPGAMDALMQKALDSKALRGDIKIKRDIKYLFKGAKGMGKGFEEGLLAANDLGTLAYYYHELGSDALSGAQYPQAIEYYMQGKHYAAEAGDVLAYFLNVTGLIIAYEFAGDRQGAMQSLLIGAASLREVFGEALDEYFFLIFEAFKVSWGEEEFKAIVDKFKEKDK